MSPLLIGNWKRVFERNDCLITVLILESVYFVVIALSIAQQIVYH
nr:NADH-plastoquinone oxidoreductase subunit I [Helleborus thibetanus]